MGRSIYHLDRIFEENPDLKSVFAYLLCSICYGSIGAGGTRRGLLHLTEIGCMIHQINQNLKENLNLKWEIGEFPFLAQKSKKEIQCGKFNLAKMGHAIYHSDRNFEENSDLKSVFAYVLCGICYSCLVLGGCNIHLAKTGHSIYHL